MSDAEQTVQLTRSELGVVHRMAEDNKATHLVIREQPLKLQDRYVQAWRNDEGVRRAYLVTFYGQPDDEPMGLIPTVLQVLIVSGPNLDGPIDVVKIAPVVQQVRP